MGRKLTKSNSNIVISGVLGGLGEYLNLDPTILRVIFIIICFFGAGTPAFIYFLFMLIMPSGRGSNKSGRDQYQRYHNYHDTTSSQSSGRPKRKEAEKVKDDEWSDF